MKRVSEAKSKCRFCGSLIKLSKLIKHRKKCLKVYLKSDTARNLRAQSIVQTEQREKDTKDKRKLHPLVEMFKFGFRGPQQ